MRRWWWHIPALICKGIRSMRWRRRRVATLASSSTATLVAPSSVASWACAPASAAVAGRWIAPTTRPKETTKPALVVTCALCRSWSILVARSSWTVIGTRPITIACLSAWWAIAIARWAVATARRAIAVATAWWAVTIAWLRAVAIALWPISITLWSSRVELRVLICVRILCILAVRVLSWLGILLVLGKPNLINFFVDDVCQLVHDVIALLGPSNHLAAADVCSVVHVHVVVNIVYSLLLQQRSDSSS
mmetsp:Transcript_19785/g.35183  ORF Transcript_19785/g.35183 Transcript_19785/m.35183 type:complete len:249 (+) Transcript_19785:337-1083(+)